MHYFRGRNLSCQISWGNLDLTECPRSAPLGWPRSLFATRGRVGCKCTRAPRIPPGHREASTYYVLKPRFGHREASTYYVLKPRFGHREASTYYVLKPRFGHREASTCLLDILPAECVETYCWQNVRRRSHVCGAAGRRSVANRPGCRDAGAPGLPASPTPTSSGSPPRNTSRPP